MLNFLSSLFQIETMITILVGMAAFATVLTVTAPFLETDRLKARMKSVGQERDRLRAAQRAQLVTGESAKLRDRVNKNIATQLVEGLNLRKIFEAESSRNLLRQAGLRSERHLVTYLAARFAVPLVLGLLVFIYSSTLYADKVAPPMRFAAAGVGIIFGYYLPSIFLKNLVKRRQDSIKRAWSDALDLMLICVEFGHVDRNGLPARGARDRLGVGTAGRRVDAHGCRALLSAGSPQGL